jgi:excisionase family DNA binding protein
MVNTTPKRKGPKPLPWSDTPKSMRMRQEREKMFTSWDEVPVTVDTRSAAKLLGVLPETVRKKVAAGEIPAYKIAREWRINKSDLMALCGVSC